MPVESSQPLMPGRVLGERAIIALPALRPAALYGISEGFRLGPQADYVLDEARGGIGREPMRVAQARAINGVKAQHGARDASYLSAREVRPDTIFLCNSRKTVRIGKT